MDEFVSDESGDSLEQVFATLMLADLAPPPHRTTLAVPEEPRPVLVAPPQAPAPAPIEVMVPPEVVWAPPSRVADQAAADLESAAHVLLGAEPMAQGSGPDRKRGRVFLAATGVAAVAAVGLAVFALAARPGGKPSRHAAIKVLTVPTSAPGATVAPVVVAPPASVVATPPSVTAPPGTSGSGAMDAIVGVVPSVARVLTDQQTSTRLTAPTTTTTTAPAPTTTTTVPGRTKPPPRTTVPTYPITVPTSPPPSYTIPSFTIPTIPVPST